MSGLKNTVTRFFNASIGKGYKTGDERRAKAAADAQAGKDAMFGNARLPDEQEIRRNERRKAAHRRGSRVETVLTDQLGG